MSVIDRQFSGVSMQDAPTDGLGFPAPPSYPAYPAEPSYGDPLGLYDSYAYPEAAQPPGVHHGTHGGWIGDWEVPADPQGAADPLADPLGGAGQAGYGGWDGWEAYPSGFPGPADPAAPAAPFEDHAAGGYQPGAWDGIPHADTAPHEVDPPAAQQDHPAAEAAFQATAAFPTARLDAGLVDSGPLDLGEIEAFESPEPAGPAAPDEAGDDGAAAVAPGAPRAAARSAHGRRRCAAPRARSAFLSVAAPSLAVLGVTAVATAATVSEDPSTEPAPVAAPDAGGIQQVAVNDEFDSRLAGMSAAADDYADRASQTQGEIDLEAQRDAEARAAAAAAARREALRPKFVLPVDQHGLSAYFGQSGINWMSLHTGIDFPVSYGTPVKAATDGQVSSQWHPSYGNLLIVTAADGTQTWYAHLSSAVHTSGHVQAGTVIAYSGNSGNSTGPHLHFEVRTGGGSAVDPLTWLRQHGLDPA